MTGPHRRHAGLPLIGATLVVTGLAVAAAGDDVAFSTDVAPVLLESCATCHDADDGAGGLRMHTLAALMAAQVVKPGQGARSLLVKKLRGTDIDGQRMPLDAPPLDEAVVARIERWIDAGALPDLLGPTATLEALVAAGRAARLSDAELAVARRAAASDAWRRALPDEEAAVEIRDRVSVVGNLPAPRLAAVADVAAEVEEQVRAELVGQDARLLKGGIVLFAFQHSYDYSAFWQEVVGAERPKGVVGHAGSTGEAVYGAILMPAGDPNDGDTRLLLAEQICGAALAGRGAPEWFTRGAGRAVASRLHPRAARVREWQRQVPAAVQATGPGAAVLEGGADPGSAAIVAGGFVGALAPKAAKLKPLVAALDRGSGFEEAFSKAFRGGPRQLYEAWMAKQAQRTPAGR